MGGAYGVSFLPYSSNAPGMPKCLAQLITPIGIAIGIGVHESYNVNGKAALLSIGILDAISAGILLCVRPLSARRLRNREPT
jgi:hypothetical protein